MWPIWYILPLVQETYTNKILLYPDCLVLMVPCLFIEKSAGLSSGSRRLLISLDLLLPIHWKWRKLSSTTSTCWFDFSRLISICSNFLKSHSSSSKYYDQRIDRWNWKIIAFSLLSNVYSSASEGVILHGLGYSLCHHQVWVSFSRLTLIWSSPLREVFLVLHGEYCSQKYDYMKHIGLHKKSLCLGKSISCDQKIKISSKKIMKYIKHIGCGFTLRLENC